MFVSIGGRIRHTHGLTLTDHLMPGWRAALATCLIAASGTIHVDAGANLLWQYGSGAWNDPGRTGVQNQSTPAIGLDGTVYVISDDFKLRAITPSDTGGVHKWVSATVTFGSSSPLFSPEHSPSVASDGTVWFATPGNPNRIYGLDPATGTKKSGMSDGIQITSPKVISAAPAIDVNDWSFTMFTDCVVAVGQNSSGTYVKKWVHIIDFSKLKLPTMASITSATLQSGGGLTWTNQLICWAEVDKNPVDGTDFNNRIFALQQKQFTDGTASTNEAWSWPFPGGKNEVPVGHLTLTSTNGLYVIGKNGSAYKLYYVNGNNGANASGWPMTLSFTPNSNPSLGADGTLYIPCSDGLRAVNPTTQAVTVLQSGMNVISTPVVGADGTIYIAYDSGTTANVRALSSTGTTLWTETLSGGSGHKFRNSALVMDRKGRLFVLRSNTAENDGQMAAFKGTGRPGFSGWPMWGRGYSRNGRAGKTWRAMELDTLGGAYSIAEGISENGWVVGGAHDNFGVYKGAFVAPGVYWWFAVFQNIAFDTPAFGVNNSGVIVGRTMQNWPTGTTMPRAYYYHPNPGQVLLNGLGGVSEAYAINGGSSTRIVGYSHFTTGLARGVKWDPFTGSGVTPTDIGNLAGGGLSYSTYAYAVSSSGRITGVSQTSGGYNHAFLTDTTGLIQGPGNDLGTLGGNTSFGFGINDAHAVVGTSENSSGVSRIFYKPFNQSMQDVGVLSGYSSATGKDVNNNNLIVGYSSGSAERAVVAVGGLAGVADLNAVTTIPSYQSLNRANAVNDWDWIVGFGLDSSWRYRAFLLKPNE